MLFDPILYLTSIALKLLLIVELMKSDGAKPTVNLRGIGASFPGPVYTKWQSCYKYERNYFVDIVPSYDIKGSGVGKQMIMEEPENYEYAGTEAVLTPQDYADYPDLQMIPTMAG